MVIDERYEAVNCSEKPNPQVQTDVNLRERGSTLKTRKDVRCFSHRFSITVAANSNRQDHSSSFQILAVERRRR